MIFALVVMRTIERQPLAVCAERIGIDLRPLTKQAKAMGLGKLPGRRRRSGRTPEEALAHKRTLDRDWQRAKRAKLTLQQLEARRAAQRARYHAKRLQLKLMEQINATSLAA